MRQGGSLLLLPLLACAAARGRGGAGSIGAPPGAAATPAPGAPGTSGGEPPPGGGPVEVARASLGPLTASKWRLGNGLEVILLPDPSATAVSYTTWFRVGSRSENEAAGETGLAHLFEHLMFTESKGGLEGAFDHAMEEVGASANAMTYYDFTAYVDDLPPDELGLAVRLESARMSGLELGKKQVETERDVVVEERLASVEDSVDGLLDELMYKQAFRVHPYRWPVIGRMKDIKAVTPDKAIAFYRRFYAPNNAVLIVAGKIDEAAALDAIARGYGGLSPSKTLPPDDVRPERAPAAAVETSLVRPVPADRLVIGFPAPGLGDADRAAYEIANELLAGGPSARLTKTLVVDKEWASSVHGDIAPTRDPGLYALWIQMTRGHTAAQAEAVVAAAVAELAQKPVPAPELARAAARLETAFWRRLASSHGRAEALGEFEIATGDFRRLFGRGGEYARVTPDDVRRVAAQYLATGARSVVVARPKGGKADRS
jgi:zinc protease